MKTVTLIPEIHPEAPDHIFRYRVLETGDLVSLPILNAVCRIKNYSAGIEHCAHPNISVTGSVSGMRKLGYWRKTDIVYRQGSAWYNVSQIVTSHLLDELCLALEDTGCKCLRSVQFLEDGSQIFTF